jgi:starch phosphorylase
VEANALYDLLEQEILPLFYNRDSNGVPRGWVQKMKNAIRLNTPQFNTARMLRDYSISGYFPSSDRYFAMTESNYSNTKAVAQWKKDVFERWYDIRIQSIDVSEETDIVVNETVDVKAVLDLAGLKPDDVSVELYLGSLNSDGEIVEGTPIPMEHTGETSDSGTVYKGSLVYRTSGLQGLSLRVLPKNQYMAHPHEMGLILWANNY